MQYLINLFNITLVWFHTGLLYGGKNVYVYVYVYQLDYAT